MIRMEERIGSRKAKDIYDAVRHRGTVSKMELLDGSGMTPSTLTRMLEELTETGLLQEVGFGESTGGRRPILYRANPDYGYAFGLEISRTRSMLVLADMQGNVLESRSWNMFDVMTPDRLLQEAAEVMTAMMEARGQGRERILGVGVGAVGPLDAASGVILDPLYFPGSGWRNVPVKEELERLLGIPALLDNGANAALVGEYWADPVKRKHLLYVHVGAGLRSAMMTNGSIVYGAVDMEGAVGQMVIDVEGVPHREPGGNRGALESYVSLHALESRIGGQGGWEGVLESLRNGDAEAVHALEEAGRYFGVGLANLLNILHPEKVVLGGPVVNAHPVFFETSVSEALKRTYYYPSAYRVEFGLGRLGETAIAAGAAIMAVNRLSV